MKRPILAAVAAAALATPAFAVPGIDVTGHRSAVSALLAEKAVNWSNVEKIVVEPVYTAEGPITDVMAFVHMRQCSDGYIVVRLTRAGKIVQSYTRNDCHVAGFDNYR